MSVKREELKQTLMEYNATADQQSAALKIWDMTTDEFQSNVTIKNFAINYLESYKQLNSIPINSICLAIIPAII